MSDDQGLIVVSLLQQEESLLGRRIELVTPESLSPYIGPRILQDVEYLSFRI